MIAIVKTTVCSQYLSCLLSPVTECMSIFANNIMFIFITESKQSIFESKRYQSVGETT